MITKEEINNICDTFNIAAFELKDNIGTSYNSVSYKLQSNDFIEFLNCATKIKANVIFYIYNYFDKDDFIISTESIKDYIRKPTKELMKKIKKNNSSVENLNFNRPHTLEAVADNGTIRVLFKITDEWIEEESICELSEIINEYEIEFEEAAKQRDREKQELLEEATKIIINDEEFTYATTISTRTIYALKFVKREGMEKYKEVLYTQNVLGEYTSPSKDVMTVIYNKYKKLKKTKK